MNDSLAIERTGHHAIPGPVLQISCTNDLDIAVEIIDRGGRKVLLGHILADDIPMFWPRIRVSLMQDGRRIQSTVATMRGEFAFQDLPDGEIRIDADMPRLKVLAKSSLH